MAIAHALPGEVISLVDSHGTTPDHVSTALFKGAQLEVVRMNIAKGRLIPKHSAPGEVTLHCLAGSVEVTLSHAVRSLGPGQLLYLSPKAEHSLRGLEDSALLLTLAL